MTGVLSWVGTWVIMILLLVLAARTSWGRPIIYWLLWMAVLLLLVTHADEISSLVNVEALQLNG